MLDFCTAKANINAIFFLFYKINPAKKKADFLETP
jgi:hypothetical protein